MWVYDAAAGIFDVLYDAGTPLSGVDNITGSASGALFVAEDGGSTIGLGLAGITYEVHGRFRSP